MASETGRGSWACSASSRRSTTRRRRSREFRRAWSPRSTGSGRARPRRRRLDRRHAARCCASSPPSDPRVRVVTPVAQLRPPGGADGRARPRPRRRRRDDRRRPPGPAGADPDDGRALARRRRRRLRGPRERAGETRAEARDRALVLPAVRARRRRSSSSRTPATSGCSTAARSTRCWLDARAQPLPARDDASGSASRRPRSRTSATPRFAGETKYTLRKMLRFSFDAISSFSHVPLQLATLLGFVFSPIAFLAIPVAIGFRIAGQFVPGITTVLLVVLLLGGIQLITVGIIGEYIGRVYDEVKRRPLYVVRDRVNMSELREPSCSTTATETRSAMRIAVIGAGMTGLVAAYRLARRGTTSTSTSAGPASAARSRRSTSATAICSSATTTTCSPATPHRRRSTRSSGWTDAIEWLPSSVAMFADGPQPPVHDPAGPAALQAALAALARADGRWRSLRLQRAAREPRAVRARDGARLDRARDGRGRRGRRSGGRCCAGKFGDRAEDISMAWLWSKLTLRRQIKGARGARQEMLGYPRGGWQPLLERLRERIEAARGPGADRPARRAVSAATDGGFRVAPGAPRLVPPRPRPARASSRPASRAATTPCSRRCPTTSSSELLDAGPAAEVGEATSAKLRSIEYHAALCLLLELDRRFSPFYWTNVADRELPFVGLIEQTNLIEPERYGGRRFLYVANYLAHGDELLELDARRAARPLRAGAAARSTPSSRATGSGSAGCFREPAAQPIVTVGYEKRIPPLADRRAAASCWPTRRRSIPRTAARTTASGWGARLRPFQMTEPSLPALADLSQPAADPAGRRRIDPPSGSSSLRRAATASSSQHRRASTRLRSRCRAGVLSCRRRSPGRSDRVRPRAARPGGAACSSHRLRGSASTCPGRRRRRRSCSRSSRAPVERRAGGVSSSASRRAGRPRTRSACWPRTASRTRSPRFARPTTSWCCSAGCCSIRRCICCSSTPTRWRSAPGPTRLGPRGAQIDVARTRVYQRPTGLVLLPA